jgi:hypothetical protein
MNEDNCDASARSFRWNYKEAIRQHQDGVLTPWEVEEEDEDDDNANT